MQQQSVHTLVESQRIEVGLLHSAVGLVVSTKIQAELRIQLLRCERRGGNKRAAAGGLDVSVISRMYEWISVVEDRM